VITSNDPSETANPLSLALDHTGRAARVGVAISGKLCHLPVQRAGNREVDRGAMRQPIDKWKGRTDEQNDDHGER
jgi:hypothetical protein